MISSAPIKSASGTAGYLVEPNTQQAGNEIGEYYGNVRSSWDGKGADLFTGENGQAVGQGNSVASHDLIKALEGRVTNADGTEKQLGTVRDGEHQHRAGWDFTFSAPKSLMGSEIYGDARIRAAHEAGVAAAMRYLERECAIARIGGERIHTGNLLYAKIEHSQSRPVGGKVDPQPHSHVVIANVTYHAESGRWYSLANEELLRHRTTADFIYKNEMAAHLQRDGFRCEFDGKGNFEMAGYSKEQLDHFSQRTQQIEDALRARGIDPATASYEARKAATLATRASKEVPDNAEAQRAEWQARAAAVGIEAPQARAEDRLRPDELSADRAVQLAMDHLTEREAAFRDQDLVRSACVFAEGRATADQLDGAILAARVDGRLIEREDGKFTTRDMVEAEKYMAARLEAGQGEHMRVMSRQEFDAALKAFEDRKGFALTDEQRGAARMILTGDDRFQGVQGLAGTGKTTMLEFIREAAESKGWHVEGFSNGGEQAAKLQAESGIESTTTARHLVNHDKAVQDADLAGRALTTWEKGGKAPDFEALKAGVERGTVERDYDSQGRVYYTDRDGNTYTPDLYLRESRLESANLNHAGLTSTSYYVSKDGDVYKQGGTLLSEAVGKLHDKYNEALNRGPQDSGLANAGKAMAEAAGNAVARPAENWQKAGPAESAIVYAKLAEKTEANHQQAATELRQQAAGMSAEPQKNLRIMDEASQSGLKEFNRVIGATEQSGARTVFIGDKLQHQGVEAGRAFEGAQRHMSVAELGRDSIRRQESEGAKEAVTKALDGKHGEALKGLPTVERRESQAAVEKKFEGKDLADKETRQAFNAEMKQARIQDNQESIKALAKDYSSQTPEQRDKTLIITATNADRTAINNEIRTNLKAQGELGQGKQFETLQKTDRTDAQLQRAASYQQGDKVQLGANYKALGQKGDTLTVQKTDARTNTVQATTEAGKTVTFDPSKIKANAYEARPREFSVGDKIRCTRNDGEIRNGTTGKVERIEGNQITVKLDGKDGRSVQIDADKYKHLEHGYGATSHRSQGQTVDRAMIHHNTEAGKHGDRETYVNVTRVREEAQVYTQDADKASQQAGVALNKESALGVEASKDNAERPSSAKEIEDGKIDKNDKVMESDSSKGGGLMALLGGGKDSEAEHSGGLSSLVSNSKGSEAEKETSVDGGSSDGKGESSLDEASQSGGKGGNDLSAAAERDSLEPDR